MSYNGSSYKSLNEIPCFSKIAKFGELAFKDDYKGFRNQFKELINKYSLLVVYQYMRPYSQSMYYRLTPIEDDDDKQNFCSDCFFAICKGRPIATAMQLTRIAVISKNENPEVAWDEFESILLLNKLSKG